MTFMKRFLTLLIAVCLLLCACGVTSDIPYQTIPKITDPSTEVTTEATTEATTESTDPPILYHHPLTGEPLDAAYTGRPTAVVINNIKACLPQFGISAADMMYEFETEGGITRYLAIFTDLDNVGSIGPVRSARTYFNNISTSYNIPLIHCGGSSKALSGMYDDANKLEDWVHIDQMSNGSYFFRDKDRRSQGYALEHTLFTTGEKLIEALASKKLNTTNENGTDYGLQFAETLTLNGEAANKVTVTFRGKKTTTMTYDAVSGLYKAGQYDRDHIDAGTGETMSYRNVLILQAKQWLKSDGKYSRSYYNLIGEGEGYFACDGQIVPIKWSRGSVTDPFVYTLADGTPLTLGIGTSYVGVIGTSGSAGVAYE